VTGRVRVGIVGTGFGARVVVPAFEAAGCEIVDAVSARDEAAVAELCRRDVDLISIHSPPFLHAAHVGMALDRGHAVLCDKPFGRSAQEAAELVEAAEAAGVVNLVNFEFRHEPARLRVAELLAAGEIGTPEHLEWTALTSGSRVPLRPFGWLFQSSLGGGWIGAWGSHVIDAVRWWLGEVTDAGAECRTVIRQRPDRQGVVHDCDAEDAFSAWLRTSGGASVAIDSSFASTVTFPSRVTITGSDGGIEIVSDHHLAIRRPDGTRQDLEFTAPPGDPHGVAMGRWAEVVRDAVIDRRQVTPSFADGLACARVMDALRSGSR
jgi:predicted dehydrogenase